MSSHCLRCGERLPVTTISAVLPHPASVTLDTLRRAVHDGHADYQAARYSRVVEQLPKLVVEAERIRCQGPNPTEDERDAAYV